jgi:CTD kinase subunit beta
MRVVSSVNFLTPTEVAQLATSTGLSQSSTFTKRQTQLLGFLQALGSRIGFPQRTIATAQLLFLRFHLFFSPSEFLPHEVAIACTVVASKIQDTPKKPKEVVLSSWALRFPEMVRSTPNVKATATNKSISDTNASTPQSHITQLGLGIISESDVDAAAVEKERKRAVSIETLILQSITFDFNVHVSESFRLSLKICRSWNLDKEFAKLSWQITADCHRTYAPISYPPSTIALGSIYCATLLRQRASKEDEMAAKIIDKFKSQSIINLTREFSTTIDCVEEVVHALLDLYSIAAPTLNSGILSSSATPLSPATPASPAETAIVEHGNNDPSSTNNRKLPSHISSPPPFGILFWLSYILGGIAPIMPSEIIADLTQIKIDLRQNEDQRKRNITEQDTNPPLTETSLLVRPFDKGGVLGDIEQGNPESIEVLTASWQERDQDKQYASLQRFLF